MKNTEGQKNMAMGHLLTLNWPRYRFSAFWLRSKCSICSYQLNIWYEVHRTSSILNWFLAGDEVSVACYGFVACRPCIAVPQGFWHTSPINNNNFEWCLYCFTLIIISGSFACIGSYETNKTIQSVWPSNQFYPLLLCDPFIETTLIVYSTLKHTLQ